MACPTNRRFLLDQKKYENIKNSEKDQIENETKPPEKHPFGTEKRDEEHQVGNDKPLEENPSKNDGKDEKYLSDLHEVVDTLKVDLEDLEKFAAEVGKERAFYRDMREKTFGRREDDERQ